MNYKVVILMMLIMQSCAEKSSNNSEKQDENLTKTSAENQSIQTNYFDNYSEVTIPISYRGLFFDDLQEQSDIKVIPQDKTKDPLFLNYLSPEKIIQHVSHYLEEIHSEHFKQRFAEYGFGDVYKVGRINNIESEHDFVLVGLQSGDHEWYSEFLFLFEFSNSRNLQQLHLVSGNSTQGANDPTLEFYRFVINGSLSFTNDDNILIKREIIEEGEERDEIMSQKTDSVIVEVK